MGTGGNSDIVLPWSHPIEREGRGGGRRRPDEGRRHQARIGERAWAHQSGLRQRH
jgi:hypothetical protein